MRLLIYFLLVFVFYACTTTRSDSNQIIISGTSDSTVQFLTIGKDTISVVNGFFQDTLYKEKSEYNYLKISTWKWARIVYLETNKSLNLDLKKKWVGVENDPFNEFLLNKDSILGQYSARWDMTDSVFRTTWEQEFPQQLQKIERFFQNKAVPTPLIEELKQMEYMLRGHLTANFISFQEKKGSKINRDIYDFVKNIDRNNERLAFHLNNQNFQHYYYLDKINDTLPSSVRPFAFIDTVNKYVKVPELKKRMISSAIKKGLYDETVDHEALFSLYEKNIGSLSKDDKIFQLYQRIQQLKPGHEAPKFGLLTDYEGKQVMVENFKGSNILLSVWGTWCPYCKEELPYLKKLIKKYPNQFKNVAIALDKENESWGNYIVENEWKATHFLDTERRSLFRKNYLISGTNVYFLIDKNGSIIASNLKPSNPELEVLIQALEQPKNQ